MTSKPPPKRDVMLALLQQAESVFVNFDPRRDGVLVPPHLKRQPRVVLQYGLNMRIPIPDLDVGEEGIGATLSFDRVPQWTFVPWAAVFAIVSQDQRGMLWESDVPREIEQEHKKATSPGEGKKNAQPPAKAGKKGKQRPTLRAVEGGQAELAPKSDGPKSDGPKSEDPKPEEPRVAAAAVGETNESGDDRPSRPSDEIVEPPSREPKKKRELPPYLRVVK
ncbi:MAG: ClpXP protease specificity-enhancing factor SspB [Polyangiales bacterium]